MIEDHHSPTPQVASLVQACQANKKLRVSILFDGVRGSRGNPNSISILRPLLDIKEKESSQSNGTRRGSEERVRVGFYHTPALRGILKKFAPDRWNEILGISHIKTFAFDDTLLLSGFATTKQTTKVFILFFLFLPNSANLSDSYFTNRQDRYVRIARNTPLTDYFCDLVEKVSDISYQVSSNGITFSSHSSLIPSSTNVILHTRCLGSPNRWN
jgi:CDP-diacylglycerol--glycerol-3-phosphate 3-phosphatidyltransferase